MPRVEQMELRVQENQEGYSSQDKKKTGGKRAALRQNSGNLQRIPLLVEHRPSHAFEETA